MSNEAAGRTPHVRVDWIRHEIRNPLNVLVGSLRLLEMGGVTPQQQKQIDMCRGAVERITRDGETFFVVRDYGRVRELFGELLREVQRIKSEGDFAAAQALIENYGTVVDRELHAEVLRRYEPLDVAPFSGFINPRLVAVTAPGADEITDVRVEYPADFAEQMLEYAAKYSFLPNVN